MLAPSARLACRLVAVVAPAMRRCGRPLWRCGGRAWTLQKIADAHGVTRQAVSDMLIRIRRGQ